MPVYIIQAGDTNMIKIGWTNQDVEGRVKALQCGTPEKLKVIRIMDGPPSAERTMHRLFADYRITGEWFLYDPLMLSIEPIWEDDRHIHARSKALTRLIERAGGVVSIADRLGITKQAVSAWERIPADRAHAIAAAFHIPLWEIRSDLWPIPESPPLPESEPSA